MAVIKDVKSFLFDFYRQRHFDLMPDAVRARFDDYAKNDDFNGNMKWWKKELIDSSTGSNNPLPTLDIAKQQELFELLQAAMEGMAAAKKKYDHNAPVKAFIEKWFGQFRPFEASKAVPGVDAAFDAVYQLLNNPSHKSEFERIIKNMVGLNDDLSYDDLLDGIRDKKYNRGDVKFRNQALKVANYIIENSKYYGVSSRGINPYTGMPIPPIEDPDRWPLGLRLSRDDIFSSLMLPDSVNDWFKATFNQPEFESVYPVILSELLEKENIRKEFANYESSGKIIGQLNKAIEATNYEDPSKPDYVAPKGADEKTVGQKIKDWGDKTYESYLRKFTEPGRGTRIYFTPFSQEIIKAIDKEKIKPTDGIAGIMGKKDAILKRLAVSPTAKKHFEWFTKTMDNISKLIPNAYAGAMKGGHQLQAVVAQVIIAAVKQGKVPEAKTALEILAVSKYGFTTSKTMDALAKENLTIFSDKGLSWNKNEGMQFVTNAMDKTLKYGFMAAGRTVAAARNAVQRSRSKFNGDIRTNADLAAAYKTWKSEDADKLAHEQAINNAHNVDARLADLAAGHGRSGEIIADDATLAAAEALLPTLTGTAKDDLQEDIDQYKSFTERKNLVDNWRSKNKDNYHDLVAYWDLMMSAMKTHSFRLGTLTARKKFLQNDNAKNVADQFIANYGNLRAA